MSDFLTTPQGRRIAYEMTDGQGPAVMFLGGFMSDMTGTKALALHDWARAEGRAFLRFDYSGHGASEGAFVDGCIGDWAADARAALGLLAGKVVLVGSSMGGWISLLLAREMPERVAGLVTIAAAPDFMEDGFWAEFDDAQRMQLMRDGQVMVPSEYDDPYPVTRRMIEDGRQNMVLRSPLPLPFPVRMLQGTADADVSRETALRLLDHAEGPDIRLTLAKGADHRFSTPACLDLITASLREVLARPA
ncbi:MAG: alpha/beta fold hydrolase [Limimaricola sp.]|uniref:alpha/beta hydrolase n=1 Tax=Limimaricola sp. TaxID=2211665 RepID=UPI001D3CAC85|nr:alpha/beta fold hydrolase [Limimaricola sp.]MBI1416519.1 alpha/beta fold hydrolase [Limimaricola sp.]